MTEGSSSPSSFTLSEPCWRLNTILRLLTNPKVVSRRSGLIRPSYDVSATTSRGISETRISVSDLSRMLVSSKSTG